MAKTEFKTIAQNKKAYHDYFVEETLEAGIELCGTEVKSLRQGRCNLKDAWCSVVDGEMLLNGCHISPYEQGNIFNRDPMRVRRLLYPKDYPEPETVARLLRHKCKVKEIPVIMRERQAGVSSISSLRKSAYYMCKVSLAILIERLR